MLAQAVEQCVVDEVRIDRELLSESECCFLPVVERSVFKIEQAIELLFRPSEPRNLRGV